MAQRLQSRNRACIPGRVFQYGRLRLHVKLYRIGLVYFVKCVKETNPQNDIDRGIVNIIVGFAPLKPAEFVIIKFQQIAGDIAT